MAHRSPASPTSVTGEYGTGDAFYQRWMVVSREAAIGAAKEFYRTGTRPAFIEWGDL